MEGFAEKGAPAGWDMALGTVRGFRCWRLCLLLNPLKATARSRIEGWGKYADVFSSHVPQVSGAYVTGMYGGKWSRGWHVAECETFHNAYALSSWFRGSHRPPEPECGCGYWAYWTTGTLYKEEDWNAALIRYNRADSYVVTIPLSGAIEGAGATIIGEKGFRSERARITDLALNLLSNCFFEDENSLVQQSFLPGLVQYSRWPLPLALYTGKPVTAFLSKLVGVAEELVQETVYEAVARCLGKDFRMHASIEALIEACPPDENYGGPPDENYGG